MGVGLKPLEFYECLGDSPYFREKLHAHEQELQRTSHQIKGLIRELKDLLAAAKHLSKAQRTLSHSLLAFDFPCIGDETDDEVVIAKSLKDLGNLIAGIEDHRDIMLEHAYDEIILPLERFRKEHIGGVKEGKKKFEKQTAKFCMSQERYLGLSTKKQDTVLKEADATLAMEHRHFVQASLEYVFLLQEVQERKKFEFVETLLRFMFSWLTFYHQGHEVACDFKPVMNELQLKLQKTRANFEATRDQAESLRNKILERAMSTVPPSGEYTREGYLYLLEKKAFGSAWSKQYCMYNKDKKEFSMLPYNQTTGKFNPIETVRLTSCVRRMSDSIEKRFCFDITVEGKPGLVYTLQALSEEDRKLWMDAMDGKEPMYAKPGKVNKSEERPLDDIGFMFVKRCIEVLESRGLEEQGLYRLVGLSSKVTKLLQMGLDRRKSEAQAALGALDDQYEWESKTITSALKTYLRNLPEPLMTFRYHSAFIAAAKQESKMRVQDVHTLVHRLPQPNFQMLDILIKHLKNVSTHNERNLMTVSNLSMCFGPTLLRPEEETVAAIMDIKFYNVVVEVLIMNYDRIFKNRPEVSSVSPRHERTSTSQNVSPRNQAQAQSSLQTVQQETRPSPPPAVVTGNGSVVHHNHMPVERQPKLHPYSIGPPPVTHAVIKSYHDGPLSVLSASMHNVASLRGDQRESGGGSNHLPSYPHSSGGGATRMIGGGREGMVGGSGMVGVGDHHSNSLSHHKLGSTTSLAGRISHGNIVTLSESNLLSLGSQLPIYGSPHHSKMTFLYGSRRDVSAERADQSQSNSSSNESVSSSPRDLGNHTGYAPIISPQKYRGGSQMESHYAKSYRPFQDARVRTLYACLGENDGELSFEPNQIITNVRSSMEPGWLEGTLNGKTGLVPENYVEFLP